MACYLSVLRIAVNAGGWTPIKCPIATTHFSIENPTVSAMTIRTERDDAHYKRLPANAEAAYGTGKAMWEPGDQVCEVQSPAGDAVVVVTFER